MRWSSVGLSNPLGDMDLRIVGEEDKKMLFSYCLLNTVFATLDGIEMI